MANKMLIDATHPEETRVVVVRGNRVEEFDFESASRRQLRGNIYLAKVTRVEPSLQAAFVDYGGNRHGFLAFSEIHPDYYQIPVADRQALIAEEERAHRAADAEVDRRAGRRHEGRAHAAASRDDVKTAPADAEETDGAEGVAVVTGEDPHQYTVDEAEADAIEREVDTITETGSWTPVIEPVAEHDDQAESAEHAAVDVAMVAESAPSEAPAIIADAGDVPPAGPAEIGDGENGDGEGSARAEDSEAEDEEDTVESVGGGDALEEVPERMPRLRRQYRSRR